MRHFQISVIFHAEIMEISTFGFDRKKVKSNIIHHGFVFKCINIIIMRV